MHYPDRHNLDDVYRAPAPEEPQVILAEFVEPSEHDPPPRRRNPWAVILPLGLFLLTCGSTYLAAGWQYALAVMTILLCHEFGHFIQTRRYGVRATLPWFLPFPLSPIGTLGAVIAMEPRIHHRRALFDIGISGPLAGLVPTLIFCVVGLYYSKPATPPPDGQGAMILGDPLLFQLLTPWISGPVPEGQELFLHPLAYAGWVGLLITSLNLFPIGQLDGGHILYSLLRRKAHLVATLLFYAAVLAVILLGLWMWTLMLILLFLMGPKHPPTTNDHEPLGWGRSALGWATLSFLFLGFTPTPFVL